MSGEGSTGGLIVCPACGKECFELRRPRYEGFTRVGEDRVCAGCGHCLSPDAPAAVRLRVPSVFSADERPKTPDPFHGDPRGRLCRYCRNYVVNPFRQWCALHRREVEATESCDRFEPSDTATSGKSED